ncbi:MAG: hypothetical protein HY080_16610 [Gammaproteobacteria bacterium]|nr:hypothetical protein [Gammaproteobacteria bacterium]
MFTSLFKLFLQIILLRKGPQDVPYSRALLGGLLLAVLGLQLFVLLVQSKEQPAVNISQQLAYIFMSALITYGGIYLILSLLHYAARAVQTITTIIGVELILALFGLTMLVMLSLAGFPAVIITVIRIVVVVWNLVVVAHIFRHAFSISLQMAGLVACGFLLLELTLQYKFGILGN